MKTYVRYGRSIGSGPTLYIASHPDYRVAGVILHSPISSGLRVLKPTIKQSPSYDLFPNVEMISHTRCPVFLMHGTDDREVPIVHGRSLVQNCKNAFDPWWVEGAGHNDIDIRFRKIYFLRIAKFVKYLFEMFSKKTEEDLKTLHKVENWTINHMYFKKRGVKYILNWIRTVGIYFGV